MSEAVHCIESPCELEAHCATKRGMRWVGYKVHLAELCEENLPNLITSVSTTLATATDVKQVFFPLGRGRRRRAAARWQLVDAAYVCGSNLVSSQARHRIDLIGSTPTRIANGRQRSKKARCGNLPHRLGEKEVRRR